MEAGVVVQQQNENFFLFLILAGCEQGHRVEGTGKNLGLPDSARGMINLLGQSKKFAGVTMALFSAPSTLYLCVVK